MKKLSLIVSTLALTLFACAAEDGSGPLTATDDSANTGEAITVLSVKLDAQGNVVSTKEEKISQAKMQALTAARKEKLEGKATAQATDKVLSAATLTQDPSCVDIPTSTWFRDQPDQGGNLLCLISDGAQSVGFNLASIGWGNGRIKSVWGDANNRGGIYRAAWSYCELPAQYGYCALWEPWTPTNISTLGCDYAIIPAWCTSIVH